MESQVKENHDGKPLKVNQKVEVEIVSKGKNGDGLGYYGSSKFVVIVPNTKIGKRYLISIGRVTKYLAFAVMIEEVK